MKLFTRSIGAEEMILLLRNIGVMLKSGVPLARALGILEGDVPKRRRAVITHLKESVEKGLPLAQAMETSPRRFPPLAINLVSAGELSGTLEGSLVAIVKHLRASQDLKRKIRGAMMYPLFVLIAIIGLGLSVGIFVLPQLIPLFESLHVDLPLSTKIILWLAKFFKANGVLAGIGAVLLFGMLVMVNTAQRTKPLMQRFLYSLPYIHTIQINAGIAQFATTLSTLLQSGIPLLTALEATGRAMQNRTFQKAVATLLPHIAAGETFSESIRATGKLFPLLTVTLISVGEESGTLAQTMEYIGVTYEAEVDNSVKNFTTALEPILLIGIGLIVGFTVFAIITPIYNITGGAVG